jgi:hypothetical protein
VGAAAVARGVFVGADALDDPVEGLKLGCGVGGSLLVGHHHGDGTVSRERARVDDAEVVAVVGEAGRDRDDGLPRRHAASITRRAFS